MNHQDKEENKVTVSSGVAETMAKMASIQFTPTDTTWVPELGDRLDVILDIIENKTPSSEVNIALKNIYDLVHTLLAQERAKEREVTLKLVEDCLDDYFRSTYPIPDSKVAMGYVLEALKDKNQ